MGEGIPAYGWASEIQPLDADSKLIALIYNLVECLNLMVKEWKNIKLTWLESVDLFNKEWSWHGGCW